MTKENLPDWAKTVLEMIMDKNLCERIKMTAKIWADGAQRVSRLLGEL